MYTLNCRGKLVVLDKPVVMGILNTTPDSFYGGSRTMLDQVKDRAEKMIEAGATILDLGGQSTRPGSIRVDAEEELRRVIPAVELVHKTFPEALISIDTYHAIVAKAAWNAGASIVNDVSAGTLDEDLLPFVADSKMPYVLMHCKGSFETMQKNPHYRNVTLEVFDWLNNKVASLNQLGIHDIIIDPGFGFGKANEHNFQLLRELSFFKELKQPLMVGLSRKATIYKTLNVTPEEALNGTTVMHTIALMNGAGILRVHDVLEAVQAIRLITALHEKEQPLVTLS